MRNLLTILIAVIGLTMLPVQAHAAGKAKSKSPQQVQKERLVLMPLRLEEEQKLQGAMESALVDGLQNKYTVMWGEEVEKKAKEIFRKENQKHECNEERCMQGIAEAFQSELLATANITKQDGGYFLTFTIQNLYDHVVVFTRSIPCEGCSAFKVIDKLKELGIAAAPVVASPAPATEPPQPKISATDPDSITWAEAQKGNTADDYQVYLDAYPKGKYVLFAKAKLKKLKEAEQVLVEQQEQQAWEAAQQENSEISLNRYLQGYPTGRFAGFAKTRIGKLKADLSYKAETELWQKAEAGMDKTAAETYLNRYPAGRYLAQANAKLQAIKEEESRYTPPVMVSIPGKNYEMGKYEVTQKEWRDIMGNNPSKFASCGENCPVEQVSWDDIQIFLQKLNSKSGRQFRLPTEEEWEYACNGGSDTKYCGSDDIDSVAWYRENSNNTTHPVGQKQANGYGLYDMSGNVWQWMENKYDSGHDWRALRGGSWLNDSDGLRASNRSYVDPTLRGLGIGFRLARTLP
ncbi:MAG: formylglycine-generating enzyme family protein [Rhodocyclaceae bacterium]|nr:formylglycine-generating enzyme family protein [Rhodocyclaceae bacterium]